MKLFSPVRIGSLEIKNRLAFAPCGTNYASEDGFPSERLLAHYRRIARGGVGLVIVEATSVNHQRRRREKHCLGIYEDPFIPPLRELVSQIHQEGAWAAIQLVDSLLAVGKRPADLSVEEIVREGRADLVALCRPLLADPAWPNKVREGRDGEITRCRCCNLCVAEVHFRGQPLVCSAWEGQEAPRSL